MPDEDRFKIESEIRDRLHEVRGRLADSRPSEEVIIRVEGVEASLLVLARYLDEALAEIRGRG